METQPKKLYRSTQDKVLFGVCGGLGEYFDVDPIIVRALFVVFALMGGGSIILYIILVLIIPSANPTLTSSQEIKQFAGELGEKAREVANEFKKEEKPSPSNSHRFFGLIVLLAGLFFLLKEFFPWHFYYYFSWLRWGIIWPLLVMALGLYLVLKSDKE